LAWFLLRTDTSRLTGINNVVGFFATIGIPMANYAAWLVAIVEFFGGIALILGLWTRVAALLVSVIMVVAIIKVKLTANFAGGSAYDIMLLATAVSTMLTGPGDWSLDARLGKKKKK